MQIFEFTINLLTQKEIDKSPEEISLKFKDIINSSSVSINNNIPNEISNEVPFILFNSQDISLHIMRKKISIKFNISEDKRNVDLKDYFKGQYFDSIIKSVFSFFQEYSVVRVGFLPIFFFKDSDGIQTIKTKFFNNNFSVDSDLLIKYNLIDNTSYGFPVNNLNIIQVADVSYGADINYETGIVLQKDINNVENKNLIFNLERLELFFDTVLNKNTFQSIEGSNYY